MYTKYICIHTCIWWRSTDGFKNISFSQNMHPKYKIWTYWLIYAKKKYSKSKHYSFCINEQIWLYHLNLHFSFYIHRGVYFQVGKEREFPPFWMILLPINSNRFGTKISAFLRFEAFRWESAACSDYVIF